ncbi:MAG: response regulator [Steroidobacteraceae bacterium]
MDVNGKPRGPAATGGPAALILVVDDDSDTLAALQLLLSVLGFEVATARSAREALRRVADLRPDRTTAALQKLPTSMQFSALSGRCSADAQLLPRSRSGWVRA